MKITHTDSRDGMVVIGTEDGEIVLNTIDAASLIGSLRASLEEAAGHPSAQSWALPGMVRIQMVETREGELLFRVFVNEQISHDYPVPPNTNLHEEMQLLSDRLEMRNMKKATPGSTANN